MRLAGLLLAGALGACCWFHPACHGPTERTPPPEFLWVGRPDPLDVGPHPCTNPEFFGGPFDAFWVGERSVEPGVGRLAVAPFRCDGPHGHGIPHWEEARIYLPDGTRDEASGLFRLRLDPTPVDGLELLRQHEYDRRFP